MMAIFTEDPDGKPNRMNQTMMPHRNYVIITEHSGRSSYPDPTAADGRDGDTVEDGYAERAEPGEGDISGQAQSHMPGPPESHTSHPSQMSESHFSPTISHVSVKSDTSSLSEASDQEALAEKRNPKNHDEEHEQKHLKDPKLAKKEAKIAGGDAKEQVKAQKDEKPEEDLPPAKKYMGGPGEASAAAPVSGTKRKYALDVSFRVEVDKTAVSMRWHWIAFVEPLADNFVCSRMARRELMDLSSQLWRREEELVLWPNRRLPVHRSRD
jgi:hypothetical protein